MTLQIRKATRADAPTILHFIQELATFEKEPNAVVNSVEEIENKLFGDDVHAHAIICEYEGEAIGFAVYFFNYSTWVGKYGLYLEDLYVTTEKRGLGAGKFIMRHLAQIAVAKDCGRFEWVVLDWNEKAMDFYHSIGAEAQREWVVYRMTGDKIQAFAEGVE
ncbi:GNAT family N-acetyltransferase [Thaumasiovibrio subtropicus]|uniref:GNAT family N-acetyltransferase n=1 Tax=Thaumasiovibrio subtropicus TaxID=1891207 RepID=UPI000B34BABB|nr:GNAT family N-acetyltransferase [Thaumasiovibrio subtropicus]